LGKADELAGETAEGQAGAISKAQLLDAGLTVKQIKGRLRRRRLLTTDARSVYRMPGAPRTWPQDLWVALLAAPPRTVVSHTSAAALRGLLPPPTTPHVTVPRGASGRFGGAVVHHAAVASADRCEFDGFPTTTMARTIVDCASVLDQDGIDALVDAAFARRLCAYRRVVSARLRAGPIRGADRLTAALAPYAGGARPGSVKEAHVLRLFQAWGLPAPECQYVIRDGRGRFVAKVDFAWPRWRVGLEYDGDEFHAPRRWLADDTRQARIEALAWRIERADRYDLRPSATRLRSLLAHLLSQPA
jgi:hypothetical protein